MQVIARAMHQPGLNQRVLDNLAIIQNDMNIDLGPGARINLFQKFQELAGAMLLVISIDHKAADNIEGADQRDSPLPRDRMGLTFGPRVV